MLYDVRLELHYDYDASVHGDRHLVRVSPISIPQVQRVIASSLSFDPRPQQESSYTDFFGNQVTTIAYVGYHDHLDVRLTARVQVEDLHSTADFSPTVDALRQEIGHPAFDRLERAWVALHKDGTAGTDDFVELASTVSGRNLEAFLEPWLYGERTPPMPGHPDWTSAAPTGTRK